MLDSYVTTTTADQNRVEAVKAALEIVKASVSAPVAYTGYQKLRHDSEFAIEHIEKIADAIQSAIDKK